MRVNVIRTSDPDLAHSIALHGIQTPEMLDTMRDKYAGFVETMGSMGGAFVDKIKNTFDYYTNSEILNDTRRMLIRSESISGDEVVYNIYSDNYRSTGFAMRGYIMANPYFYDKYTNNRCVGYDDAWYDSEPNQNNPVLREDYLRAIDGTMQFGDDDGTTTYYSDDNPLTIEERYVIQDTWDRLEHMMSNDVDPTNLGG